MVESGLEIAKSSRKVAKIRQASKCQIKLKGCQTKLTSGLEITKSCPKITKIKPKNRHFKGQIRFKRFPN